MLRYKNIGRVTKTFHGVTFRPGETKSVSGYINAPTFIRVNEEVASSFSSNSVQVEDSKPEPASKPVSAKLAKQQTQSKKDPAPVVSSVVVSTVESKGDSSLDPKKPDSSESKG